MTSADPTQLSEYLHHLKARQDGDEAAPTHEPSCKPSKTPISRDGYGFRKSGVSTPQISDQISDTLPVSQRVTDLVPDPHGLGWPGLHCFFPNFYNLTFILAKSTISRLNASPEEKAAREQKMASAVRTILECIGEDPDREGLQRTPQRYAQAIMWMTRGYEERLAG